MHRLKTIAIAILFSSIAAVAQPPWTGIIDSKRAVDWTNVGAPHINDTRTQCVTTACNTVAGGTVTAASINSALSGAPANTYVLVPSGTFTMSTTVTFANRSNVTLRGAGSNSTFLVWSGTTGSGNCAGHDVCASSSDTNYSLGPSNTANWTGTNGTTGTYTQGATSIILSNTTNLVVGNPLILDQVDVSSDTGNLYIGCELPADSSANCYSGTSSSGFQRGNSSLSTIRGQQQIVTVTSIAGSTVGISPGIYAPNWATARSPGAWWATSPVQNDAIENMSLDHTNGGDGITFFNCQGCWVKGIRSVRKATTGTGWGHVIWSICNKCEVKDSYMYGWTGDTYGIAGDIASDSLAENNIFQYPSASQFYNSDCEGCVAGYNFSVSSLFGTGPFTWMGNSEELHAPSIYALAEGNIGSGYNADLQHGTHGFNTAFRNRWDGREQNSNTTVSSNTVAWRATPGTRYENVIGNILGTIGYHTNYKSSPSGTSLYNSIYGCGTYPEAGMGGDSLSCPTSMFWGNFDVVTNNSRWCGNSSDTRWSTTCGSTSEIPTSASTYPNSVPTLGDTGAGQGALPASFYYTAKPSWWPGGKAWPPIGPDVTGGNVGQCAGGSQQSNEVIASTQCPSSSRTAFATVNSIPAMDCYYTTMGGAPDGVSGPYAFDSNLCYNSSLLSTSTSIGASTTTPVAGTSVLLTATITPSSGPTGTVTFFDGASSIGSGSVSSGTATFNVTAITAGVHSYTATYNGDSTYASSTSSPVVVTASSASVGNKFTTGISTTTGIAIR